MVKYLEIAFDNNIIYITSWRFKGLSGLDINPIKRNNNLLNPRIDQYDTTKKILKFNGSILNRSPPSINRGEIVNIYVVYEITKNYNDSSYPTVENCLFGSAKLTKKANIDKYGYFGYAIGFDRKGSFSHPSGGTGKNIIIFEVDMSSSSKIDITKKYILILGKGPTQELEHTHSAEKMYSINFTKKIQNFV